MNPRKLIIAALLLAAVLAFFALDLGRYVSLAFIKDSQSSFQALFEKHPAGVTLAFFAAYVAVTALSLPGATLMTLVAGAGLGLVLGTVVVSFASTLGATLAMLAARYLLRGSIQARFGRRLADIDKGMEKEGAFYLFTLRLIPVLPFFVLNLLMGLTRIRTWTYIWVSQLGMLPATVVYVNAGTQLAKVDSLRSIASPALLASFALLGLLPLLVKRGLQFFRRRRVYARSAIAPHDSVERYTGLGVEVLQGHARIRGPKRPHLLLLGAGHAHLHVLQGLARSRPADLDISVIAPYPRQLYSGMVPGFVAGHYALEECIIPLAGLLARCGARLLQGSAVALDADARTVTLASGETLTWDWLSLNTGAVMDRERIEAAMPGAREHALFVRPMEAFAGLWPRLAGLARSRPMALAVIGAGAAGLELAMAAAHALRGPGYAPGSRVTLLTGGPPPASSYPPALQRRVARALQRMNITVLREACAGMAAGELQLAGGARLACDAPLLAVGAQAPGWLAGSGLVLDEAGFVAVNPCQQSVSHDRVFAVGDVASRADAPQPRSGVHAVRAGPPLLANLRAAWRGQALVPWQPPARTLNLIACGERHAIAAWGGLQVEGRWVWRLKASIDRGFVARYAAP